MNDLMEIQRDSEIKMIQITQELIAKFNRSFSKWDKKAKSALFCRLQTATNK